MSMRRQLAIALGLSTAALAMPVSVSAQAINGTYGQDSCQAGADSEMGVEVAWPTITYFESRCTITGSVAGMENTYTTSCTGEGETWAGRMQIQPLADGGLTLVSNGISTTYIRC